MKKMKKFVTLALVLVMVLGLATTAMAAEDGTITITPPSNVNSDATNTYKIYKVFDAVASGTNISYTLVEGKTDAPEGFDVNEQGNVTYEGNGTNGQLTADDIAAIAEYVANDEPVATVTSTGPADAVSDPLPNGYYYITTSVGTVVTINSTTPNAVVEDKNTVPTIDKKTTGDFVLDTNGEIALAEVGKDVGYDATVVVGAGAKGYIFHDTMTDGLTYNNDVKVFVDDVEVPASTGEGEETVTNFTVVKEGNDTFTVKFADSYISTLTVGEEIVIKYSAKVNKDAVEIDVENNTAYVSYGDSNGNYKTPEDTTKVYTASINVIKVDGNGDPLGGAKFKLMNADGEYYKWDADNGVTWVTEANAPEVEAAAVYDAEDPTKVESYTAVFQGLANGTYTLVETTVPEGYNKAADQAVTINFADTDLGETDPDPVVARVTNQSGSALPSTGGMGTTLFYVFGAIMVMGAAVLLVTKKRMAR